jgi:hypothetical protein
MIRPTGLLPLEGYLDYKDFKIIWISAEIETDTQFTQSNAKQTYKVLGNTVTVPVLMI